MVVNSRNKCKNCEIEIVIEKKFCSSSCSATFNNKQRGKKEEFGNCLECDGQLKRNHRKFCSNKCQGTFASKKTFEAIEKGDLNFHEETFKRYLIFKHGNKCMLCGWDKINSYTNKVPVQIEHEDGNSENNDLKNLKLLCPNCHSLTKTWGGANKGRGRKKRKEKRQKENMPT